MKELRKGRETEYKRTEQSHFNSASTLFSNHMGKQIIAAALQSVEVVRAMGYKWSAMEIYSGGRRRGTYKTYDDLREGSSNLNGNRNKCHGKFRSRAADKGY